MNQLKNMAEESGSASDDENTPPKKKRTRYNYSNEELSQAIAAVNSGEAAYSVARRTKVPYTTLMKKIKTNSLGKS